MGKSEIVFRNRSTFGALVESAPMIAKNVILDPERLTHYFKDYRLFRQVQGTPDLYVRQESTKATLTESNCPRNQIVLAIMGPTSSGKNSAIRMFENQLSEHEYARVRTSTTRKQREDEMEADHDFISRQVFKERRQDHKFIEAIHQHDNWYGTTQKQLEDALKTKAPIIILEVDIFGFTAINKHLREQEIPTVSVFLLPAMPIRDYLQRIYETRAVEFVSRYPKSMAEIKRAPKIVDAFILNPPSKDQNPTHVFNTLMGFLSENVKGI